ncbi:MAG: DUF177 domain-containing protein [Bacteroidales bacterium]|nr:DUF177 domain-containing protein [Bacteroidales bacterium]
MEKEAQYLISLQLDHGKTTVSNFKLDNAFFESIDNDELHGGEIEAEVQLTKNSNSFLLEIYIEGLVLLTCDRCLDLCKVELIADDEIIAEYAEETNFDTGKDNITVLMGETELNIKSLFRDLILTSLPVKRVHNPELGIEQVCNSEMIEILNKHIKEESDYIDPRWEKLKDLKTN